MRIKDSMYTVFQQGFFDSLLIEILTKDFLHSHPRVAKKLRRFKDKEKAFDYGIKDIPIFYKFARRLNAI